MTRRILALALIALSTSGCGYLRLQNPQTADVRSCGRIPVAPWYGLQRAQDELYQEVVCAWELDGQGYRRVPGEPRYRVGPVAHPLF